MKGKESMDLGTAIAVILVVGGIIALIVAFLLMFAKINEVNANAYATRMSAKRDYEKGMIEAAHVNLIGGTAFVFTGFDKKSNEVLWDKFPVGRVDDVDNSHTEEAQIDPRHAWLSELIKLTLTTNGYGPHSTKLVTCDRAEQEHKQIGGVFADRTKWTEAVKYGIEIGLIMTSNQGTLIKEPLHASDLGHELLLRSPVLKALVDALPESRPAL